MLCFLFKFWFSTSKQREDVNWQLFYVSMFESLAEIKIEIYLRLNCIDIYDDE